MTATQKHFPKLVVGIGASAGGLAAFKSFLAQIPADTGMAFVLVQHLDPHHKSLLVELLGAHSPIPVVAAQDELAVKENCVFVIPPDATLAIENGVLQVQTPAPPREHRRPVDTFFTALAEDYGERAVGIVLSGVGSDGTIGIRTIKEHGGLTLAQAEVDATALQGMPSSAVATGLVDHVLPVEAMPARLIAYHKHLIEVAEKKDGDGQRGDLQEHLEKITSLLHARSEHDFSGYKETTLIRRLQRRMQVLHIDSAPAYIERLTTDRSEIEALFREFLIGVTQFFRDPEAFDALKTKAVAPLLAAKGEDEPVRVWVPGCSTGEEVYSIAILVREALQARGRLPEVILFGTDIDANAVAIARTGRYRRPATGLLPGLSPERFERWFTRAGDDDCVVPEIRDMCVFSTHSLVKDPPFSRLDLLSCRNVLIYLEEELQDRLMRTFHYALLPGGYLYLGTAESVTRNSRLFTALDKKHRILQRRDAGATLTAFPPKEVPALEQAATLPVRRRSTDDRIDKAVARVMHQYAPAYFVIDRNQEITRFSGAETGHYLEPSEGTASLNLFSIVHKSLKPAVKAAVNLVLAGGPTVINENLSLRIDGKARALTLIVEPIGGENGAKTHSGCVVAFRDTTHLAATEVTEAPASDANVQALERELRGTKAQLQAATDELESRIEDMKSVSEEFQAVNEELQSANEELETSKEEMQSINEELQTINSELNNKNEILTRLNSDMQNLMDSTQIATAFLDDELRLRHFTPALMQLFSVRDMDRGRPITDIVSQLDYTQIRADVEKVQRDGVIVERELALKDSAQVFLMRIRSYRTVKGDSDGVVITFVDISEQRHHVERLHFMAESMPQKIFTATPSGDIDYFNQQWMEFTGLTFEQIRDWGWLQFIHPEDREENIRRWKHCIDTGEYFELEHRFRSNDGRYRWHLSRAQTMRNAEGKVLLWIGSNTDIDDQKRIEAALRESDERYRFLFASAPMAVFVCDQNAVIQQYNSGAAEIWGKEPVRGVDSVLDSLHLRLPDGSPLLRAQSPLVELLRTGTAVHNAEIIIERPDGARVPILVNSGAIRNAQGEIVGAITAFVDITDKKQTEERQQLLTRELQHRTKNLLAVILVLAQRSLSNNRPLDEARQVFAARLHALAHATELLTNGSWQGASLSDVVKGTLGTFSGRYSIEGEPIELTPSATQDFALILHELCTNAGKHGAYSVPDGQVAIRWSVAETGDQPKLVFCWQERAGPRVAPPKHTSFGTTLLERAISGIEHPATIDYAPEGLTYTLEAPLAAIAAKAWLKQRGGGGDIDDLH